MSRNDPATPIWEANIMTPWGGRDLFMSAAEALEYNADPDAWAAAYWGLSKADYLEWLDTAGSCLCRGITAKGKPCSNGTGHGIMCDAPHWKQHHRKHLCAVHRGKTTRK